MSDITWTNDTRKLSDLVPWEHNPKRMTKKQADGLRLSLEHFGFAVPFLVSPDGDIYDGHQRQTLMDAMREYGPSATVDVRVSSRPLTDDERREMVVRLRQNQAGWDFDMLPNLYDKEELLEWGFEPEELGLFPDEPTGDDPGPQIDRADELREKWGVETGQLWQLGEHRLICGDCTEDDTWERLLDGVKVNGVFTSPPYAEQRKDQYGGVPASQYVWWWNAVQANVKANLAADGSFFVNIKPHCENGERALYVFDLVCAMRRLWRWRFVDELCWTHQGFPGEPQDRFQNAFEPIYHFAHGKGIKFRPDAVAYYSESVIDYEQGLNLRQRERATSKLSPQSAIKHKAGMAFPRNVLRISSASTDVPEHAAAFPVALPSFFILAYSDEGDSWLDPFCGSGTTIIAAHQNNRRGYGIELLPAYCAVAIERFYVMTGIEPVLLEPR